MARLYDIIHRFYFPPKLAIWGRLSVGLEWTCRSYIESGEPLPTEVAVRGLHVGTNKEFPLLLLHIAFGLCSAHLYSNIRRAILI